ncbi:oxidative stress survival, Svf1-like protein [Auricularia subglabra TFB-10046 SS5]|nr:oxidative stress survival, Svf1-like protein [Auricularia subglabra TFB-10046 SS5]
MLTCSYPRRKSIQRSGKGGAGLLQRSNEVAANSFFDLQWTCAGGFVSETQTFYQFTEEGLLIMLQVIHASVGVWYPTVQFVVHVYDPKTKERVWSSTNVSNFSATGGKEDKRSCKAKEFTVVHSDAGGSESYTIMAQPAKDLQVSVVLTRAADAPGWKLGKGPKGGRSFFGRDPDGPDGYVVHRFWPRTHTSGHIVYKGKAISVDGSGMLVHAIQGMRPNLVACRWNFAHFQSEAFGGTSAIMMELTTTRAHGPEGMGSGNVKVNIGSIVVGGKLVAVTGETHLPRVPEKTTERPVVSRATHLEPQKDPETEYQVPTKIEFSWRGPAIVDGAQEVSASLTTDVGTPQAPIGLIQKVDFLGEIPSAIKGVVSYVAGVKPYIYQWANPAKLTLRAKGLLPDGQEEVVVDGWLNNEATFICEP